MKTQNGNKGRDIAILNEVIKEGPPPPRKVSGLKESHRLLE